jgi:alpha-tubulin suppressor-like RCC1 family protein
VLLITDSASFEAPEIFELPGEVVEAAAGQSHFVLQTQNPAAIWSLSKDNRFGQLGRRQRVQALAPVPFFEDLNVRQIACGDLHAMAVSDEGGLYAFGSNNKGQCGGFGGHEPTLVEFDVGSEEQPDVKQVACGSMHTVALMEDGAFRATVLAQRRYWNRARLRDW